MSIIKVFNSYFNNDINKIIYEYYFDDSKIIQARKDFLIEYHKTVRIDDYDYDHYNYRDKVSYHGHSVNYRPEIHIKWIKYNNNPKLESRSSTHTIFRFDNPYYGVQCNEIPDNYILYREYVLRNIVEHPNLYPDIPTEWARKQLLLKNRFEVK